VVVPPPELRDAPWGLVPSFGSAALTLTSSATAWAAATRRTAAARGRAVLIAGPDLRHAVSEVRAVAAHHRDVTVLGRTHAKAPRVRRELDGVWLAHLATHHHLGHESPLFGSFTLTDGPFFMHDLLRVNALPTIVVLSACEAGRGNTSPGGDPLSASTVMMERGTMSVIASSSLVADDGTTIATMDELHRLLASGVTPAAALLALRTAVAEADPATRMLTSAYCCFGRG
jgi:CHAT domain-containing protein